MAMSFSLSRYLARIGLERGPATLQTLHDVMGAHSRAIAFENIDVVLGLPVAMDEASVFSKMTAGRGGYCFEHNTLLQSALVAIGFRVTPLLCRVRWNKTAETPCTHMALRVELEGSPGYLVDVGFTGTNSVAPIRLADGELQSLPEGVFRVVSSGTGAATTKTLALQLKGEWRDLYEFEDTPARLVDLEQANWWSCTYPNARFVSSFFVSRVIGDDRHHILDAVYSIRRAGGTSEAMPIVDDAHLRSLLSATFGLDLPECTGLDRYLPAAAAAVEK